MLPPRGAPLLGAGDDQRLSSLAKRQESVLCRLFADAFATHFVGPAYVHALLHLRFIPNRTLLGVQ